MRAYLGHRLPGGYYGGISVSRRRLRRAARAGGGMSFGGLVLVVLAMALAVAYWWVTLPLLALAGVGCWLICRRWPTPR